MKALVCGGRGFGDRRFAFAVLDHIHARRPITHLVEGGAAGADTLGYKWARARGIPTTTVMADWWLYGNDAGSWRNVDMLFEERPDLVVALPGQWGTLHMIRTTVFARNNNYLGVELIDAELDFGRLNAVHRL